MVGAVLLPALARHYRHLSQGPAGGGTGERTSDGKNYEKNCHQILPPGLHPLHQKAVLKTQEEVSNHVLNRHFKVAMTIVDEHEDPPELKKDIFWNQVDPELIEHPELDVEEVLIDYKEDFIFH